MLNAIKNALTKMTPAVAPIHPDAPDKIWGAKMTLERATKAAERKTLELAEARSRLAQMEQTLGEKMGMEKTRTPQRERYRLLN